MRIPLIMTCMALSCSLISCVKSDDNLLPADDPDSLRQSIIFRRIATIPSPADIARGLLNDTISVFKTKGRNSPDFLTNMFHVSAYSTNGFSFGYQDPSKSVAYFAFTAYAFPDVPREFQLNKVYSHFSTPGGVYERPLFLGAHNGFDGMNYFVNNVYPPEAPGRAFSRTYTSVQFTKKMKILMRPNYRDTALFGSGHISGYCMDYYSKTDTSRYVHRWDFTVDFTDLRIDP